MIDRLPIDAVVPQIRASLERGKRLVLVAPPGAGKSTRLPIALLDEAWAREGRLVLLEPRRIAARMAAERMALSLGEKVGRTIGLSTRVDRRVSAATRIEVVTDGLFTRRIVDDPSLEGVAGIFFDEFHERSLNVDLGLALALEAQAALREEVRLIVMSATLDGARVAARIDAPVVESAGRQHPVETLYIGEPTGRDAMRLEDRVAGVVTRALREQEGSVLAFLPGRGEILRTAERLHRLGDDVIVAPLYGAMSPAAQDRAVSPTPPGVRKVVLATDIAESALTIDGVSCVVDAGLARLSVFDPKIGASALVTRRASRANVDQRRGRAGRLGPGVCYRLWSEGATRGLPAEPPPEIATADLSGFALALALWGERDPDNLILLDPPGNNRWRAALETLKSIGAIDADGQLTPRGRAVANLPMDPRTAILIVGAKTPEDRALAAEVAALASEPGLGGGSVDLRDRLRAFRKDASGRARTLKAQAARWADGASPAQPGEAGRIIAETTPSMIARARPGERGRYLLAVGREARLDADDALAAAPWLAVVSIVGGAKGARIALAAPLTPEEALTCGDVVEEDRTEFDAGAGKVRARRVRAMGAIVLSETPLQRPSNVAIRTALMQAVRAEGIGLIPGRGAIDVLRRRAEIAALASESLALDLSDAALLDALDVWFAPALGEPASLEKADEASVAKHLVAMLDWPTAQQIEALAPASIRAPSGRALAIDYLCELGPTVSARVQEFFGCDAHPAIAGGRKPITVSLLSPAHRPVAVTTDLPGFWRGGYKDMAKDMRARYPKHDWPDNPQTVAPHTGKTKKI